ncbi:MAG: TonB-dependent receptor, partial [Bacteroidota bacterium]
RNTIDYTVNNSLNRSLEESSPTSFNPGGYAFGNQILNWDISKTIEKISLAFGAEFRREYFETKAGEQASYSPAPGTDSFPGLTPDNAVDENRSNIGVYASADYDINEAFLIGGAVRFENYSDFGSNFSWKVNSRYLIGEIGAVRASVSTGFRAPSLHQIYLSNIQTTAGASGLIQEGTFSNVDDVTRNILGVDQLDAETSLNFTAGFTFKLADNVSLSADYYNITVSDRVLFSDQIGADNFTGSALGDALANANVDAFKFFINAADTKTSGVDIVLSADNLALGDGGNNLDITLAANFNDVEIDGEISAPAAFGDVSIFGDVPANLLTSARPNSKIAVGLNLDLGKFSAALNNTQFGKVNSPTSGQEFGGKVITDLLLNYDVAVNFRIGITVNNLLDVYPDRIDINLDPFGSRLQYPWRVSQFGFNGRYMKLRASYDF